MPYVVRWVPSGAEDELESPEYDRPSDAMEFACAILSQRPARIWIENEAGARIDQPTIAQACQERRAPRR